MRGGEGCVCVCVCARARAHTHTHRGWFTACFTSGPLLGAFPAPQSLPLSHLYDKHCGHVSVVTSFQTLLVKSFGPKQLLRRLANRGPSPSQDLQHYSLVHSWPGPFRFTLRLSAFRIWALELS